MSSETRSTVIARVFIGAAVVSGVALVGAAAYEETRPLSGTVVSTTYEPEHEYTVIIGKVPVPMHEERWTVQVDMDGDGRSDKDVVITKEQFDALEPGDHYDR